MKRYYYFIGALLLFLIVLSGCKPSSPLDSLEEWDLIWISDSSGWGVAEVYADAIEADTGKKVNLMDAWSGGLPAGEIRNALVEGKTMNMKLEQAAEQIKDAEVIVIYGNPELSIDPANPMDWNCGQGSNVFYVNSCEMETFNLYIQHLEEIYAKIFELREGQPTIIRAFDAYNPVIPRETAQEGYPACLACWANYNAAIHQAAETFNVPVAKVAEAWNGADGTEDPVAKGYTKDNIHPNELGAKVIAEALRDLGFEPVYPPK